MWLQLVQTSVVSPGSDPSRCGTLRHLLPPVSLSLSPVPKLSPSSPELDISFTASTENRKEKMFDEEENYGKHVDSSTF